jgi:hypothetical protein
MDLLKAIRLFAQERRGSYSMIAALAFPVVVGFVGLGTETGLWFYTHQSMQSAADGAAFSAATAYVKGSTTGYTDEGRAVAARYSFVNGVNGTTVAVNRPPLSGPNAANQNAVEVIIQQPQRRLFSAVLANTAFSISARAVAATAAAGTICVLGLDPTAANTVSLSNNAILPDPTCGVASNSSAANALALSNNARIDGPVNSHGGIALSNNATLTGNPILSNAAPIPDPYATADAGAPPACTAQNGAGTNNGSRTLQPDVYVNGTGFARFCGGLNFTNNFTVTFLPGVYFIDSRLIFGNNASINGTGVTLIINGNYAINIGNNAHVDISAPTSGPTAGIVFFGSRTGTSTVTQRFSNNTVLNLTGALYFPNQILELDNNASTAPNGGCTQVIGRRVVLMNNVDLGANCAGTGITPMNLGGSVALRE